MLSKVERDFIEQGIQADVRSDGRSRTELRPYQIEMQFLPQANGSCRIRSQLPGDDEFRDEVMAVIKADIGEPSVDKPDQGRIICTVTSTSTLSLNGLTLSRSTTSSVEEPWYVFMSQFLERALYQCTVKSSQGDSKKRTLEGWQKLCIVPGKKCWVLHVDVTLANPCYAHQIDWIFMACRIALQSLQLPFVTGVVGDADVADVILDDVNNSMEDDFDSSGEGSAWFIDATREEDTCCTARLHTLVFPNGDIAMTQKTGSGVITTTLLKQILQVNHVLAQPLFDKYIEPLLSYL